MKVNGLPSSVFLVGSDDNEPVVLSNNVTVWHALIELLALVVRVVKVPGYLVLQKVFEINKKLVLLN